MDCPLLLVGDRIQGLFLSEDDSVLEIGQITFESGYWSTGIDIKVVERTYTSINCDSIFRQDFMEVRVQMTIPIDMNMIDT